MSASSHSQSAARKYSSPLRDEQAAETRLRIVRAAAKLFASAGYDGTSLADLAREAGVSLGTLKANGPKRDLLFAAFELSFAGAEGVDTLATHEPIAEITADSDNERYILGITHFVAESNRRSNQLWAALVSAATSDAAVHSTLGGLRSRRREDMLVLVDELRRRGMASAKAPRERQADALSFVLSPEGYSQLVTEAGWSHADYETWLRHTVLLASASDPFAK
ncbi:TetR family transcriptional regulator [Leucobacter komagatae]|uniref:TetR family transcriptional regulator n=1 Tax=Leucobacter komagatae TaxID=55969 RepID=A0A542Y8K2_9MICO|nr:TetR family transcriptional regulator [Leucobacter komagatae]TQL44420.1 TetR family transcriptional regulator [Leucobacter komagatae]